MNRKKILIIGGTGYIGGSLYSYLKQFRYEVDTLDLEWFGNKVNPKNILMDYTCLSHEEVSEYSHIILLAGHSSVPSCNGNFIWAYRNNVSNFVELLAKINPNQTFIFASSSSVYGNLKEGRPYTEDCISCKPLNTYDLTKSFCDYAASLAGKRYFALRFGTLAGLNISNTRADIMINAMVKNGIEKKNIEIFNKDIKRPMLGIADLNRAFLRIIEDESAPSGVYNLASFNSTVDKISQEVSKLLNVPILDKGVTPILPYDFEIDCSKFKETFDFEFKEDIITIVKPLVENFKDIEWTTRNEAICYE